MRPRRDLKVWRMQPRFPSFATGASPSSADTQSPVVEKGPQLPLDYRFQIGRKLLLRPDSYLAGLSAAAIIARIGQWLA